MKLCYCLTQLLILSELSIFATIFERKIDMDIGILEDTIIAIATPPGIGAISVIRLSGTNAFEAIDKIFLGKTKIKNSKTHTIHYGKLCDDIEIIDDVLVSVFKEPNSYTGEDIVEISHHGSPLIANKIISLILSKSDVRLAEPGEFTKRAFLNGKIDLAQAEAVADLINSRVAVSLRGARNQLNGLLSAKINDLRKRLIDLSSFTELELDFAEEDIQLISRVDLVHKINNISLEIGELIESYSFGKVIREGFNLVLAGEPNVGKSSILNYLVKESRAIVSHIPGTTRDTIIEEISIDGFFLRLYDTAGIRNTDELIEKEGVERSRGEVKKADVVIFVGDVNVGFSEDLEAQLLELNPSVKIIKVLNKIDLGVNKDFNEDFKISALSGIGMIEFIDGLKTMSFGENVYTEKDAIVTNIRHMNCLIKANKALLKSKKTVEKNLSGEFLASDLWVAEMALAEIIGEVTPEEILNNIFSKFCIGK
jgi:tRNA modification GTPase